MALGVLQGKIMQYLRNQDKLSLLIKLINVLEKIHSPSEINLF